VYAAQVTLDAPSGLRYLPTVTENHPARNLNAAESQAITKLMARYRERCLWYLKENFVPTTLPEALQVLDAIEQHGDLAAFRETRRLRAWLSPASSAISAAS
jgi:hypothetical protein